MMWWFMTVPGLRGLYRFCFGGLAMLLLVIASTSTHCIAAYTPVLIDCMVLYTPAAEERAGGRGCDNNTYLQWCNYR